MSTRSDISQSAGWYRFEAKTFQFTITDAAGDPVDLTDVNMLWRVSRDAGSGVVYLEKTSEITVEGDDDNIATIAIDPETDYADLDAGIWYHELWNLDSNALLVYGDAWILPAAEPVASP